MTFDIFGVPVNFEDKTQFNNGIGRYRTALLDLEVLEQQNDNIYAV